MSSSENTNITLYSYWRSSSAWRVRIALALKDLPYEYTAVNLLHKQQASEEFSDKNPSKQVPAIVIDGHTIAQSLAIIQYLEETRPNQGQALLPNSPIDRALVRQFSDMVASGTQPLQNLNVLNRIAQITNDDAQKKNWAAHWIQTGLEACEKFVKKYSTSGRFCVGDSVSMADLCLIPQLYNARRFDVDLSQFPTLLSIESHCASLEAFQKAHPDVQPDAPKE